MDTHLTPRFSIIVPAYKAAESLEPTVDSVLAQTYPDFEVVISDDGSPDDTLARARELAERDDRVRVITGENGGCASARNRAIAEARGVFFCLLDADDRYEPDYLERTASFIDEHPDCDIYSCNGTRVFPGGRSEPFLKGPAYADETSWTLDDIIVVNHIFIMSTVRKTLWERLGGFRAELRYAEDYDFWMRALASGACQRYQPLALGVYSESPTGKSRNRVPHAQTQIRIFEDLARADGLTDHQRDLCAEKIGLLRLRIERVEMEQRLQRGEFRGARGTYLRVKPAYLSAKLYYTGLALMMVSPRLYAAAYRRRNA